VSRFLIVAALVLSAVLAVLLLLDTGTLSFTAALGWLFVVLGVYLASLLVP